MGNDIGYQTILLRRPVDFPISCDFGVKGKHWKSGYHKGVDFGCPVGSEVFACRSGEVKLAGEEKSFGKRIWIVSKLTYSVWILYAHLSEIFVKAGQKVEEGQKIGLSGNTGNSSGPHLHVQVERYPSRGLLKPEFYDNDRV